MGKILLTGGAGFIGAHTAVEMLESGHEVVVVDNFVNSSAESIRRVEKITGKKVALYEADVCDRAAMDKIFSENDIEAVIHFAGLKAVGESVSKPLLYYSNNLVSTLTLLDVMKAHGCNRIVFSSSATVYGEDSKGVCTEDMHLTFSCSNPYGRTKFMIERILTDAAAADPELGVVLLRYFNPVGAHASGLIGEDPNGIPNNLMPRVLRAAVGKMDHIGVFGTDYPTPDGTCRRDYIHVVDLARGHVAAINYLDGFKGVEVVNLGTGMPYSVLDILNTFEEATGVRLNRVMEPRRAGDLPESYADPAKAERVLGWKATHTLADMCRDAWKWQTLNPNGYKG